MADYKVALKNVAPLLVVSRKVTIPTNQQVPEYLGGAFDEAYGLLKNRGMKAVGPCLAIWHQPASVLANEVAEGAVPIGQAIDGTDRVLVYELEGGQFVSVTHEGPFDAMTQAHGALLSWAESEGHQIAGSYREVYLREGSGGSEPVTEIQYRVA